MNSLQKYIDIYKPKDPILTEEDIDALEWRTGEWADGSGEFDHYQNCGASFCTNQSMYDRLTSWARDCATMYGFQKNFGIHAGSSPRFNRYVKGEFMEKHYDHIYSCFDGNLKGIPVLSIIGVLNEEYEGGDLVFYLDGEEYIPKLKTGDTIVFPSAFPWAHEVKPVTSGTRYTWVSWAW